MSLKSAENAAKSADKHFRKKFPYRSKYNHSAEELSLIKHKFERWFVFVLFLQLALMTVLTAAMGFAFFQLYLTLFELFKSQQVVFLHYHWLIFCIPGFLLSCTMLFYPLEAIQKVLMGTNYPIYNDYYCSLVGYDSSKAIKELTRLCRRLVLIVLIPIITSGIIVDVNSFSIKHFYSLYPKRYEVSQIDKVLYYSFYSNGSGKKYTMSHAVIKFKNGDALKTINWDFSSRNVVDMILLLRQRGVSIDTPGASIAGEGR